MEGETEIVKELQDERNFLKKWRREGKRWKEGGEEGGRGAGKADLAGTLV